MNDAVTWGAVVAAIGALATIIGFWTRFSDRVTKAETAARQASLDAAETKRLAELACVETRRQAEASVTEAKREAHEAATRAQSLEAKIYQVEIWARDEFVRKASFETVVARLERGFGELRSDIGSRLDRMSDRIDDAIKKDGGDK